MSCFADLNTICQPDAPLRDYTWYRLGGPARWLLTPRNEQELAAVLRRCHENGLDWRVLGWGANVLVRDEGFAGAVIRLAGPVWERVRWDEPCVEAAAGADFPKLVKQSVERGLAGLENLSGIPGSVGGIIRMNAGGKYGEIGRYTCAVRVMDSCGEMTTLTPAQVGFSYRHTNLAGRVVLGGRFELVSVSGMADQQELLQRFQRIWREKHAAQPAVAHRSAGCVFRNPPGDYAGRLIDAAGLKGTRIGGAEISREHANFIVADGGATAQNVLDLISLAKERVRARAGIELVLEVEVW